MSGFKIEPLEDGTCSIVDYEGEEKELVIPDVIDNMRVTKIGDGAFYCRPELTSVTLPDSIISIGSLAFYYCGSLTSIFLPESLVYIEEDAFECCPFLSAYVRVSSWARYAAINREGGWTMDRHLIDASSGEEVTEVILPDSLEYIGENAFACCFS